MSRRGDIELTWGDGKRRFRLAIGELGDLEKATGLGPFELFEKILAKKWRVREIRDTILYGLVGGGLDKFEAVDLIDRHIDDWPWTENVAIALEVLNAALAGDPNDQPGKQKAGEEPLVGPSPASSGTAPRSASRRKKSTG